MKRLQTGTVLSDHISRLYAESVDLAENAYKAGTFGVGGVMVDNTGRVLFHMQNAVIAQSFPKDPTAHVERQLIDKYYDELAKGTPLPAPNECLIISSLDPCLMCGGAALAAGFRVLTANLDPFVSVNWDGTGLFPNLPKSLRPSARRNFIYAAVPELGQAYQGPNLKIFRDVVIGAALHQRAEAAIQQSFQSVRDTINTAAGTTPNTNTPKQQSVADITAEAVRLENILNSAAEKAQQNGHKKQAGLLMNQNGQILQVAADQTGHSPIATALMLTMRGYAAKRWDARANPEILEQLPHPKHCVYVQLYGPDRSAASMADLGAFGSSIEGPLPENNKNAFRYIHPSISARGLDVIMSALPPFYRDHVGMRVTSFTHNTGHNKKAGLAPR